MKEIKQKPAGGKPKTADAARVPKAVVKAAWLQAREAARAGKSRLLAGRTEHIPVRRILGKKARISW